MIEFKKNLKILIFSLSIILFCNSNSIAAVSGLITEKDVTGAGNGPTESSVNGMAFNDDGTKMYYVGFAGKVYEFALSTPFSLSSATYSSGEDCNFTTAVQVKPQDITFNSNGTAMFVTGSNPDDINKFSLSVPYDVSTCDIDGRSTHVVGGDPRGISFNNDGTKLFIYNGNGNDGNDSVDQYSLQSPFNLSNMVLQKSYIGPDGTTLKSIEKFPQGIAFSFDGTKMFLTGNNKFKVNEFNLSTAYDLSDVTHVGGYEVSNHNNGLKGIAFNSDGSKIFLTDFNSGDHISEYSLTCNYGVISCPDPTTNKDDVAMVEAQSESAKQIIQRSTYPVLNRMNWLRRNENQTNLVSQNIRLQFSNELLNLLSKNLAPRFASNLNNGNTKRSNLDWSFWSEGSVSIGKVGDTSSSSFKDINTTGVTVGADKIYENNVTKGIAINFSSDDVDIGHLGSGLNSKSAGFTFYTSRPKGENKYFDTLIGLNLISMSINNNTGSSSTKGDRDGEQIFGSFNLIDRYETKYLNFSPNIKLNYGATYLSKYKEVGDGIKLEFGDQIIGTLISSVGSSFDKKININNSIIIPFFDFEYLADISPSSKQTFNYASDKDKNYTIRNINNSTHNIHSGIGFDLQMDSGLVMLTKYQRNQAIGSGHTDNYIIGIDYNSFDDKFYTMSFKNYDFKFSHQRMLKKFNLNIDSNYNFFETNPEYGFYVRLSDQF